MILVSKDQWDLDAADNTEAMLWERLGLCVERAGDGEYTIV